MEKEIQALGERVARLIEITRKLADENKTLKGHLGEAVAIRSDLERRIAEARGRVESALARMPITQEREA